MTQTCMGGFCEQNDSSPNQCVGTPLWRMQKGGREPDASLCTQMQLSPVVLIGRLGSEGDGPGHGAVCIAAYDAEDWSVVCHCCDSAHANQRAVRLPFWHLRCSPTVLRLPDLAPRQSSLHQFWVHANQLLWLNGTHRCHAIVGDSVKTFVQCVQVLHVGFEAWHLCKRHQSCPRLVSHSTT